MHASMEIGVQIVDTARPLIEQKDVFYGCGKRRRERDRARELSARVQLGT